MKKLKWLVIFAAILASCLVVNSSAFWSLSSLAFGSKHYSEPVAQSKLNPQENTVTFNLTELWLAGCYTVYIKSNETENFEVKGSLSGEHFSDDEFSTQASSKSKIVTFKYDLISSFLSKSIKLKFETEIPDDATFFIVRCY
jgi:hypothetical protein